jgi:neurotransmitter:Na+ symporter, NSS family
LKRKDGQNQSFASQSVQSLTSWESQFLSALASGVTSPSLAKGSLTFDYFGSNISLPLGGLAAAILVGWFWGEKDAVAEISNNGEIKGIIVKAWFPVVKYVVPVTLF